MVLTQNLAKPRNNISSAGGLAIYNHTLPPIYIYIYIYIYLYIYIYMCKFVGNPGELLFVGNINRKIYLSYLDRKLQPLYN